MQYARWLVDGGEELVTVLSEEIVIEICMIFMRRAKNTASVEVMLIC